MRRLLCTLLFIGLMVPGLTAPSVTLPERASVDGAQIVLGDIAAVQGTDDEAARLMSIVLAPAPIPGQRYVLTPAMVRVKLRQFGFNPNDVALMCPAAVEISRKSVIISGKALVASAESWLRARIAVAAGDELVLTALSTPPDTAAVDGVVAIVCLPTGSETGTTRLVQMVTTVNGATAWRGTLSFRLQRFGAVLVAQRAVAVHGAIIAADVQLQRCEITALTGTPLHDAALLVGCRATRALRAGEVLTCDTVEVVPVVMRNQDVMVIAHCGELVIRLRAVACQDGGIGSTITVRNPQSHQEFSARVMNAGEVEVVL